MATKTSKFAKKYARMLFNVTGVEKAATTLEHLKIIQHLVEADKQMKNFFMSPTISDEERLKGIDALAEKIGLSDELKKFLIYITERRAIVSLPDIIRHYTTLYYEKQRKAKATVISPVRFNGDYERRLLEALRKLTDREVEIEYVHDPDLIGGIVVKVGSTMYDSSIKGQLRLLKEELIKG
jgi:ATP synthase F1 delta subunit